MASVCFTNTFIESFTFSSLEIKVVIEVTKPLRVIGKGPR